MRVEDRPQTHFFSMERDVNKGDSERLEVGSRLVPREIKQKGADSNFAGTPPLALVRYVMSRAATKSKTGKRRQLIVLDAKLAFLYADALAETYVKPPHVRDTETMLVTEEIHVWHTSCSSIMASPRS